METLIPWIAHSLEIVGITIITVAAVQAVYRLIKNKFDLQCEAIKLRLAKALELSLEFKLAAEILKTVIIRTMDEIFMLAAVMAIRIILTFVIHWEIQHTPIPLQNSDKKSGGGKLKG